MTSMRHRLLVLGLRITRRKRWHQHPHLLRERLTRLRAREDHRPPRRFFETHRVRVEHIDGFPSYTIEPMGNGGPHHVFYLHGGSYLHQIEAEHWSFLGRLVRAIGCTVTVPIYPLAPRYGYKDAYAMVTTAYRRAVSKYDPTSMTLMGDSAGGGFALGLAQSLREADLPQPKEIVLLSPWLDLTMSHRDVPAVDATDPWLAAAGLIEAGRMFAKGDDPNQFRLSPINGPIVDLGALSIFVGTRDVLWPDARRLWERAHIEGVALDYFESDGLVHDFPLIGFLPEARRAFGQICGLIRR
jgi:acetyl esterase/lipase